MVLLETLTGKKIYTGDTIADTLAAVIKDPPALSSLPADTPPFLRKLLERCLEKDPRQRLRDIGEARVAIERYLANPDGGADVPRQAEAHPTLPAKLPWVLLAVTALSALAGWYIAARPAPLRPLIRLEAEMRAEFSALGSSGSGIMAISPDGARIVTALPGMDETTRLYSRLVQQDQVVPLAGTENATTPFLSPYGQWIGFVADGKLKKISVDGGAAVTLYDVSVVRGASWGDDGNIVLALGANSFLSRVSSVGGAPAQLSKLSDGERSHRWPQVLAGSQAVVFTSIGIGNNDYHNANVDVLLLKSGVRKTLVKGGAFVPMVEKISANINAGGKVASASNGTMIFLAGDQSRQLSKLMLLDSAGKGEPLQVTPGCIRHTAFFARRQAPRILEASQGRRNGSPGNGPGPGHPIPPDILDG